MKRCECIGIPFEEIERRLRQGQSLDEVQQETGCGQLCSSCVPDLHRLAAAEGRTAGEGWPPEGQPRRDR